MIYWWGHSRHLTRKIRPWSSKEACPSKQMLPCYNNTCHSQHTPNITLDCHLISEEINFLHQQKGIKTFTKVRPMAKLHKVFGPHQGSHPCTSLSITLIYGSYKKTMKGYNDTMIVNASFLTPAQNKSSWDDLVMDPCIVDLVAISQHPRVCIVGDCIVWTTCLWDAT